MLHIFLIELIIIIWEHVRNHDGIQRMVQDLAGTTENYHCHQNGEAPDGDLVALAGLRSKHNTYMSIPLIWTMINEHTSYFSGGNLGFTAQYGWLVLMGIVALGWHIVFQIYKKSAKVQGF